MRERFLIVLVAGVAAVVGCGGGPSAASPTPAATTSVAPDPTAAATRSASGDWTRFGYDAQRTGVAPSGPSASAVAGLSARTVDLPGTVDSSPILVGGTLVVTTTYGITLGLDPASGAQKWRFTPGSYSSLKGSSQITTASPVADPSRRFVFAASADGRIHKLRVADGSEVTSGPWPVSVTRDATHEKLASALNLDGRYVLATTGGYIGDAPPYQGKVVAIDRLSGRLAHVWNSLCSGRRRIITPSSCGASDSAIWGRGGAVVAAGTHRIYVATGNGPFDGRQDWGDSVLELTRAAGGLRRHYTPVTQSALSDADADLGSASPALVPSGRPAYVLQGGKDGRLRLLSLKSSLHAPGPRLGGEVQVLPQPGGQNVVSAPLVLGREVVVATAGGTAAYTLRGGRLHARWSSSAPGTSPVMAGGLLYVYDPTGALNVYRPAGGTLVKRFGGLPAGHWNSPIVARGRVYVPTGDANQHATSGKLVILG
jgi:outer membrane protein assembly factor BamB